MSDLFGRNAKVVFGVRKNVGKDVTGLRVKFKIEKTLEPSPNKASIQITNLNENSRALAEKKGLVLVLSVGYGEDLEEIFSGDIVRTFSELQRADIITTFESGDGLLAFQSARTDKSFAAGSSLKDVFKQVIGSFTGGDGGKADLSAVSNGTLNGGLTLSGLSRKHMDDICKREGLEWSIQDGIFQVLPKGGNVAKAAVLLSPSTGLIGIPKKKNGGIDAVSLCQPKLRPGRLVQLQSKFIEGTFCIQKVTHEGDTHDSSWFSTIEAKPVNGTVLNNAGQGKVTL